MKKWGSKRLTSPRLCDQLDTNIVGLQTCFSHYKSWLFQLGKWHNKERDQAGNKWSSSEHLQTTKPNHSDFKVLLSGSQKIMCSHAVFLFSFQSSRLGVSLPTAVVLGLPERKVESWLYAIWFLYLQKMGLGELCLENKWNMKVYYSQLPWLPVPLLTRQENLSSIDSRVEESMPDKWKKYCTLKLDNPNR